MKKLFRIIKFKSKPILVAKNLSKSFNKRLVLNQINFQLNRGEIFGILGPNGSGKTTLFNLILGVHSLDNGKITINGETINSYPIHFRCSNYKISYVPQNSACLLNLSGDLLQLLYYSILELPDQQIARLKKCYDPKEYRK